MWLYFPAKNLSHSERTWRCDHTFQPKIYPILRGPGYVILALGMKSNKILWGQDYKIILSSQKPISTWGDLTIWLYFPAKIYPILRGHDYVIIS